MDNQFDDDFQFKPLTEGLGFHKKTLELQEDAFKSVTTQTGILPQSKKTMSPPLTSMPLASSALASPALGRSNFLESVATTSKISSTKVAKKLVMEKQPTQFVYASYLWSAAFFDTAIVGGLCLLFSAVVFALTKVEISTVADGIQHELGLQLASGMILFAVAEIYTVSCRGFFAKTLGEWVFEARLGLPAEQNSLAYPFKVAFRTFLLLATGIVVLPAISSAIGKDVAGILSGVKLYSENR